MSGHRFCLPLCWTSGYEKNYQDLARELRKIWNMKAKVIQLVISALGTTPIKLRNCLKEIGIEIRITELQKTVLLNIA